MSGAMFGGGASDELTNLMKAYNDYTYGQAVISNDQAFAKSGVPVSTMNTAANIGGEANKVFMETRESDALRASNQAESNAQKGTISSGIGAAGSLLGAGFGGI